MSRPKSEQFVIPILSEWRNTAATEKLASTENADDCLKPIAYSPENRLRLFDCYRAMLCAPCWRKMSVCLSVCLSHPAVMSKRLNNPETFLSRSGSHTILVFHTKLLGNNPTGTPKRGRRMPGFEKNRGFPPISRFVSEIMKNRCHSYYGTRIGNRIKTFKW